MNVTNLTILVEQLELIKNNIHGGLKNNTDVQLTHSEVIGFVRAFLLAVDAEAIYLLELSDSEMTRVKFWLQLICVRGILHRDRSRAANKCLNVIEQARKKKLEKQQSECSGYPE